MMKRLMIPVFKFPRVLIVSFSLLLAPPLAVGQAERSVGSFYEDAVKHFNAGRLKHTHIQLQNALQRDSRHIPTHLLLGRLYLENGSPARAIEALRSARKLGADENLIAIPLASAYLFLSKHDELNDYITRRGRSIPIEAELEVIFAISLHRRGLHHKAWDTIISARGLDATNLRALKTYLDMARGRRDEASVAQAMSELKVLDEAEYWIAETDMALGRKDFAAALSAAEKVRGLVADTTATDIQIAKIKFFQGKYAEAAAAFEPLVVNPLASVELLYMYSVALRNLDQPRLADQFLQRTEARLTQLGQLAMSKRPSLYLIDAKVAATKRDPLRAQKSLELFLKHYPKHSEAGVLLGNVLQIQGKLEPALVQFDKVYPKMRSNAVFLKDYGKLLLANGFATRGMAMLEQAARRLGSDRDILFDLARGRIKLGQRERAIEELTKAFDEGNRDPKIGLLLGYTELNRSNFEAAANVAAKLIESDPDNPAYYALDGQIAYSNGEPEKALSQLEQALVIDPTFLPAAFSLVEMEIRKQDFEAAEIRLRNMAKHSPNSREIEFQRAKISESRGALDDAIKRLEGLRDNYPDSTKEALELVRLFREVGRGEDSIRLARKLHDTHRGNYPTVRALVETLLSHNEMEKAARVLQNRLLDSGSLSPSELFEIGRFQVLARNPKSAKKTFERVLVYRKKHIPTRMALLRVETQLRGYERALQLADEIAALAPKMPLGQALRGDILVHAGRLDEAAGALQNALDIYPSTSLHLKAFNLNRKLGARKEAGAAIKAWAQSRPKDQGAQHALASVLADLGDHQGAIAILRKLQATAAPGAGTAIIKNALAWSLLQSGDLDGALRLAREAYAANQNDSNILDTYGWVLSETGEHEKGLGLLRRAYSTSSNNLQIRFHVAATLARLARKDEAADMLRDLLNKVAGHPLRFAEESEARSLLASLKRK